MHKFFPEDEWLQVLLLWQYLRLVREFWGSAINWVWCPEYRAFFFPPNFSCWCSKGVSSWKHRDQAQTYPHRVLGKIEDHSPNHPRFAWEHRPYSRSHLKSQLFEIVQTLFSSLKRMIRRMKFFGRCGFEFQCEQIAICSFFEHFIKFPRGSSPSERVIPMVGYFLNVLKNMKYKIECLCDVNSPDWSTTEPYCVSWINCKHWSISSCVIRNRFVFVITTDA